VVESRKVIVRVYSDEPLEQFRLLKDGIFALSPDPKALVVVHRSAVFLLVDEGDTVIGHPLRPTNLFARASREA